MSIAEWKSSIRDAEIHVEQNPSKELDYLTCFCFSRALRLAYHFFP